MFFSYSLSSQDEQQSNTITTIITITTTTTITNTTTTTTITNTTTTSTITNTITTTITNTITTTINTTTTTTITNTTTTITNTTTTTITNTTTTTITNTTTTTITNTTTTITNTTTTITNTTTTTTITNTTTTTTITNTTTTTTITNTTTTTTITNTTTTTTLDTHNYNLSLFCRMVVAQRGVIPPPKHYADAAWFKYILSCCAATTAEMVTYPLDLTKTRLQIQGERGLNGTGSKRHPAQPYRGLARTAVGIVSEEGLLKLWQGVTPAVYRHLIYSGTRMVLYEKVREDLFTIRPDGTRPVWQAIVGGILVGGVAQLLASPADLIKVQMQMEGRRILEGKPPRIHSAGEAFVKIYQAGGVRGLWKGCTPNVYRSAFVNLGDLTTYDSVKRYFMTSWGLADNYWTHALSSFYSGLVSASLGSPADVVKARIMNQPTGPDGRGLLYHNSLDCLLKTHFRGMEVKTEEYRMHKKTRNLKLV
ncbi:hypothetical protein Pcinc_015031 [Petrolisthes cinctipes]|uniref:Mitochondrial uncoupling protein 4 n=1 Tax=Petrolisthes cinctipes TaxID=88211 RepID=A0AAE1FTY7_PETCI|nr:hypothetical protein Pcinc_015031 [Petrolisthes cinctipes]